MTFQEYLTEMAILYPRSQEHVRMGQAYMNYLCMVRQDLYDKVTGSQYDPFYIDAILPEFLSWVAENWQ